jgi:hypothetical protein
LCLFDEPRYLGEVAMVLRRAVVQWFGVFWNPDLSVRHASEGTYWHKPKICAPKLVR